MIKIDKSYLEKELKAPLEKELSNIYGKLSILDCKSKIIHIGIDNITYFCNIKTETQEIPLIAKAYKEHSNLEENILSLFDEFYKEHEIPTPRPIYYDKKGKILIREYISGYTFKEKMDMLKERIDDLNKEFKSKLHDEEKLLKIASIVTKNKENYLKAAIIKLAEIHNKLSSKRKITEALELINGDFYLRDFIEDIENIFKIKHKKYNKEDINEIKEAFKTSPLYNFLKTDLKESRGFITGDYYSENILLKNGKNEDFIKLVSSKEINVDDIIKDIKVLDLEKARIGPVTSDLADLLYDPRFNLKETQIQDLALTYSSKIKELSGEDIYPDAHKFLKSVANISILRSLRGAVNAEKRKDRIGYMNFFKKELEKDKHLETLTRLIKNILEPKNQIPMVTL